MTVIEEWNELQSLESEQISFSISTAVEIGTTTSIESLNDISESGDSSTRNLNTGLDQAFSEIDYNGYGETETDWELLAACRSTKGSADLFFSEELGEIAAAKRICADCPVIAPCLEGALSRGEPCGVWGGQLFSNGRVLAQKRRRGRPPKVARPEDQLPVVPVPAHLQKLIA